MHTYLNNNLKTLIIIPSKYHSLLNQELLKNSEIIFNVSLLSIETFFIDCLKFNNIKYPEQTTIIEKISLAHLLANNNHHYQNNTNYIDQLFKLKQEFMLSNVSISNDLNLNINYEKYDFNKLRTTYDQIIIYTYEDFMPIHYELTNNLNIPIIELKQSFKPNYNLHEHNNTIRMLDYIVYDLYHKEYYNNILIICDDILQQDYLINQFNKLNIPYTLENEQPKLVYYQIASLFKFLENSTSAYDINNIKLLFGNDYDLINSLQEVDYYEYIKKLYEILSRLKYFEISKLNKLFSELYLSEEVSISLLNNYLLTALQSQLKNKQIFNQNTIYIASSSFNSYQFEHAYIVDASFTNSSPTKASYLLNTLQREEISADLLSNPKYVEIFKHDQARILNCAKNIYFHYSLININNKPQSLAFFIDELNIDITKNKDFAHLITSEPDNNLSLDINQQTLLSSTNIIKRFNHEIKLSASALDTFYQCPYQYFISYILNPNTQKEFSYLNTGTLNHEIMEYINSYILINKLSYQSLSIEKIDSLIDEVLLPSVAKIKEKYKLNDYDLLKLLNRTKLVIKTNIMAHKEFEKHSNFSIDSVEKNLSFTLQHENISQVKLVGKIDAIFNYQDYYYILDYKSSTKSFNEKSFISGLSSQLIVYLALLNNKGYNLTGAFYKPIKDNYEKTNTILDIENNTQIKLAAQQLDGLLIDNPLIEKFDTTFSTSPKSNICTSHYAIGRSKSNILEYEKIKEYLNILDNLCTKMLDSIANGQFDIQPYDENSCTYCDYKNICKVNNFTITRKELESHE